MKRRFRRRAQNGALRRRPTDQRSEHSQAETDQTHTTDLEIQTANAIVRSTKEARVYMQELGADLYVKLVEASPSESSLGRF